MPLTICIIDGCLLVEPLHLSWYSFTNSARLNFLNSAIYQEQNDWIRLRIQMFLSLSVSSATCTCMRCESSEFINKIKMYKNFHKIRPLMAKTTAGSGSTSLPYSDARNNFFTFSTSTNLRGHPFRLSIPIIKNNKFLLCSHYKNLECTSHRNCNRKKY